jgi:hypothetical protein
VRGYTRGFTSGGYWRARRAVATLHLRAANHNKHAGRLWDKSLADNHQVIEVEDSKAKFLASLRNCARADSWVVEAAGTGVHR